MILHVHVPLYILCNCMLLYAKDGKGLKLDKFFFQASI